MVFLTKFFILVYMCIKLVRLRAFIDKLERLFSWEKCPAMKKDPPKNVQLF